MKGCCEWCCSRGRGKSETSAGRSCFGNENDEGMGCFSDLRRNEKCRAEVSRRRGNGHSVGEIQCCTAVFRHRRNEQCCTAVFQRHEKSSVLKNGVSAS
jgi:hypothetical protein